jgi:NADH-quinone oxidoreductase subunit A
MTPTSIVAYLTLFVAVGGLFPLLSLVIGWFLRAWLPSAEKLQSYECGEQAVGSSFVQFDLRFYVIALVFLIFEVEVAFFFPWATVFGKATQLKGLGTVAAAAPADQQAVFDYALVEKYRELEARPASPTLQPADRATIVDDARKLALASMADLAVFFAVLLVGFAYVWNRGDLTWVRAMGSPGAVGELQPSGLTPVESLR